MGTLLRQFSVILLYLHSGCVDTCNDLYTKKPMCNYRCVASASTDVALYQEDFPQCIWRCLRNELCRYINHNSITGACELGFVQCEYLKADVGFLFNMFGLPHDDCLHWRPSNQTGRIPIKTYQGSQLLHVARIVSENILLIGKYRSLDRDFWANKEDVRIRAYATNQSIEILTSENACSVLWMDYTAGKALHVGAVAGGHLADGTVTYVAKIMHNGQHVFGYYNSKRELAYYELSGVHTAASMQILVLM